MTLLNVGGLTKYFGAELIFADVSFQIARGEKMAIVGVNGAGKSTLLRIIAGVEDATRGGVHLARGVRVATLAQEARFVAGQTLRAELATAITHIAELRDEIADLEHLIADHEHPDWNERLERYGEATERFELAGGYDLDRRTEMVLDGLGFVEAQLDQPLQQFSGGQKTRAAMAIALLSDPDILLLDEPTNHLDLAALEWLERFLLDWKGTMIVVSHDRYFLNRVTNRTIEIAFNRLDGDYPGGYNKYLDLKMAKLELQLKMYNAQQDQIAKQEEYIRRFKNSTLSTQARGRERRLDRLKNGYRGSDGQWHDDMIKSPDQQKKLAFSLAADARGAEVALRLDGLTVGYAGSAERDGRELVTVQSLELPRARRVALMGPNGAGKTTLLRTMVGELPPLRGHVRVGHRVTLNYYAQAHEGLRPNATVLEEVRRVKANFKEGEIRTMLGRFLFSGDDVFKKIGDLSGGERGRVALAQLLVLGGNLLVLDEPTNHLDIDARGALENVLNEYNGTILFVSHDRYFIDAVADTIWMVRDGDIEVFDGNYTDYVAARDAAAKPKSAAQARDALRAEPVKPAALTPVAASSNGVPSNGAKPALPVDEKESRRRQRRQSAIEGEIAGIEADMKRVETDLERASTTGDTKKITLLGKQHADMQTMLQTRYDEWAAVAG